MLCAVAVAGSSFVASACVAASSDADCKFVPISGLATRGESKSVTIEISDGQWPQYPLGPGTEWAADSPPPSWAPADGKVVGTATYGQRNDLSVDFGQGRVVTFPHVGCS
jgi:hypothetical protein